MPVLDQRRRKSIIRPDGRGFVFRVPFPTSPFKSQGEALAKPGEALAKIASGDYEDSFTFDDKELYRKIHALISPLRNATGQDTLPLPSGDDVKFPGVDGKLVLQCAQSSYQSSETIFWTGDFNFGDRSDLSYFSNSVAGTECLPFDKARGRLAEVKRLVYRKLPKELMQRWVREYEVSKKK